MVGINLEDSENERKEMFPLDAAVDRIKRVLAIARAKGVPDFTIDARTDALLHGLPLSEAIDQGKVYLEAGATTVFVWGGSIRGESRRARSLNSPGLFKGG